MILKGFLGVGGCLGRDKPFYGLIFGVICLNTLHIGCLGGLGCHILLFLAVLWLFGFLVSFFKTLKTFLNCLSVYIVGLRIKVSRFFNFIRFNTLYVPSRIFKGIY